jgi:hypothetical protein
MSKMLAVPGAFLAAALLTVPPAVGLAQPAEDTPVSHGPLEPAVTDRVRRFVSNLAEDFGGFYPGAEFRNVRAVYFASGAIIVCGEMNKAAPEGEGGRLGWRYFTNSGPLIYESDHLETLCDRRAYAQQGFADDHEYGPEFTRAAEQGVTNGIAS